MFRARFPRLKALSDELVKLSHNDSGLGDIVVRLSISPPSVDLLQRGLWRRWWRRWCWRRPRRRQGWWSIDLRKYLSQRVCRGAVVAIAASTKATMNCGECGSAEGCTHPCCISRVHWLAGCCTTTTTRRQLLGGVLRLRYGVQWLRCRPRAKAALSASAVWAVNSRELSTAEGCTCTGGASVVLRLAWQRGRTRNREEGARDRDQVRTPGRRHLAHPALRCRIAVRRWRRSSATAGRPAGAQHHKEEYRAPPLPPRAVGL